MRDRTSERLLDQVTSGLRGDASHQHVMPHGAALFRLWAAMRELMTEAGSGVANPLAAPLWDRALGLWAGKASWFGLHAHVWMGPLAAVNSQVVLRRDLGNDPRFREAHDVREPTGARASAIYSVAQRMHTRQRKLDHYRQTITLATQAIEHDPDAGAGSLSIRGYALMRMARLGQVWKMWEAVEDFRKALALRERSAKSAASLGEAKVDLGLSFVMTGHIRTGFALLQEGVSLMRGNQSANGQAALARSLRKLEGAARLTLRRGVAEAAREERLNIATEVDALDQARDR
jgi:tetratricopeptide (TPR) repeat protein